MNRYIRLAALGILVAVGVTSPLVDAHGESPSRELRVGLILPLSGEAANYGNSLRHGVAIARERLTPAQSQALDLRFEDDAMLPARAVSAFRMLKDSYRPDVIVTFTSGTSKAIAAVAESTATPQIAIASDPAVCRGKKHVVNFWVTPETEAAALSAEVRRRGLKRFARINTEHDGPLAVSSALEGSAAEFVLSENYAADVRDFRPFLLKAKRLSFDGFVILLMPGQVGVFARQAREQGFTQPLFGFETFEDPSEVSASNGALVGNWFVTGASPAAEFVDAVRARDPGTSLPSAAAGHDIIALLAAGLSSGKIRPDARAGEQIDAYLRSIENFPGASGTFSSTDDNRFTLPAVVKVVTESGFEELRPNGTDE